MHVRELPWLEPFSAVRRLSDRPHLTFLDSAAPHGGLGRYSYLACDPFAVFTVLPEDGTAVVPKYCCASASFTTATLGASGVAAAAPNSSEYIVLMSLSASGGRRTSTGAGAARKMGENGGRFTPKMAPMKMQCHQQ